MQLNYIGLAGAGALFLGVWSGHVAVRHIEYRTNRLWLAVSGTLGLGSAFVFLSLYTESSLASAVFGILATTVLWDALELVRQEKRVQVGHAPANPSNPRHARFLAMPGSRATTLDLLKRSPTGKATAMDSPEDPVR